MPRRPRRPRTVRRFMRGPGSERVRVPRGVFDSRGQRIQPATPGRQPRGSASSTIGGETLPAARPAGPPPRTVLRDNQSLFPRRQQSYHGSTSGRPGPGSSWRPAPTEGAATNPSRINAEVAQLPISEGTRRRLATLDPEEQNRLVRGAVTAGLPQDDQTYNRLLDARNAAALTPGEPTAQSQAEAADIGSISIDGLISDSEEISQARASILGGREGPEPTDAEIADEIQAIRDEEEAREPLELYVPTTPPIDFSYDDLAPTGAETEQPVEAAGGD